MTSLDPRTDVVQAVEADLRAYENWSWETAEPCRAVPTMTEIEQCCNEDTVRTVETWFRELVRRVRVAERISAKE